MTREEIIEGLLDIHAVTANYKGDQVILHSMPMKKLTGILYGAAELLKAQEPRVMSINEVVGPRIIEIKYDKELDDGDYATGITIEEHPLNAIVEVTGYGYRDKPTECVEFDCNPKDLSDVLWLPVSEYGKTWRCWTSTPTKEQRWQS